MRIQEIEIIEITFEILNLNIINPGLYYFFTKKGFNNGGIKIKANSFSNILCKKIDDIENIGDINYKELLRDTYDCIINEDLIEYPILESKSYFIFSAKLYSNPNIYLYDQDEAEKKSKEKEEHQQQENEDSEEQKRKKNIGKWALICFLVFVVGTPILLCLIKAGLAEKLMDYILCLPYGFALYLSPFAIIPCIILFIIYLAS